MQRGTVSDQITFPGRVILGDEQDLFFDVAGRIDEVYVDSGQQVAADQPIAKLYAGGQEYSVADARMAVELARERQSNAEEEWEFDKRAADTELEIAKRSLAAIQSMASSDPLELFVEEQRVQQAQLEVDRLVQGVDSEMAIQLERAELALERAQEQLSETLLTAPADGQLLFLLPLEQGTTVSAFETVATLVNPDSLQIEASLVASDMAALYEGMPVSISPENRPSVVMTGTITSIPQPIGTGIGTSTLIDLDDDAAKDILRTGANVEVTAIKQQTDNALWIPPMAVQGLPDNPYVQVREGTELREQEIQIGIATAEQVEVVSGLQEDDEVIGG